MSVQKRKSPRLEGYDYSLPGAYFVTLCTKEKKCLFSNIVGAIHESPENILTPYGEYVRQAIEVLPDRFGILIPKYVIMPNHLHLIIVIEQQKSERAIRESPLQKRSVIDKAIGFLKMNSSKNIHNTYKESIWQKSFHDHIIRGDEDYLKIWNYIDTNPLKWELDCFYTKKPQ